MQASDKTEVFENLSVPKAVASLAIPTILSQLVTMIYNLADTFFVGQTGDPNQVAAVSFAYPAFMILTAIGNLFGVGGGSLLSRLLGAKKSEDANRVAAFSFWGCMLTSAVYGLITLVFMDQVLAILGFTPNTFAFGRDYVFWVISLGAVPTCGSLILGHLLRSEGAARQASIGIAIGGLLNIVLDPIFIFGFHMDVAGAALATMLSNVAAFLYYLAVLYHMRYQTVLSVNPRHAKISWEYIKPVFSIGLPASLATILVCISNTVINNLARAYGDVAVAAIGIVKKIDTIPINVCMGMSQGILPLIAYNYAAKNFERMKAVNRFARMVVMCFAFLCILVFELFSPYIVRLFIPDAQTIALGSRFLRIACLATPVIGINWMMNTTFQAMGKGTQSLIFSACRQGLFNIPLLFLMNYLIGVDGLLWTQLLADSLTMIVSFTLYRFLIKQLEREEEAAESGEQPQAQPALGLQEELVGMQASKE